jgi:hypothetical protein
MECCIRIAQGSDLDKVPANRGTRGPRTEYLYNNKLLYEKKSKLFFGFAFGFHFQLNSL